MTNRITLRQVPHAVANTEIFNCNDTLYSETDGGKYIVYSYGKHFPVAVRINSKWYVNQDKFSPTTGRHQHMVRMGLIGENQTGVDTPTIKAMV
jgi:hypothetical protein